MNAFKRGLCVLTAALPLLSLLSACGASGGTEVSSSGVDMPNPLVTVADTKALRDATDVCIEVPVDAENVRCTVLDGTIAQVEFTASLADYTLRGTAAASSGEASFDAADVTALSGVYDSTVETFVLPVAAGGALTQVTALTYAQADQMLYAWTWEGQRYTLFAKAVQPSNEINTAVLALGFSARMNQCVQLTADAPESEDAAEYLSRTRVTRGNAEEYCTDYTVDEVTLLPSPADFADSFYADTLRQYSVDDMGVAQADTGYGLSWYEFLQQYPSAAVYAFSGSFTKNKEIHEDAGDCELLAQAANGSWYIVARGNRVSPP